MSIIRADVLSGCETNYDFEKQLITYWDEFHTWWKSLPKAEQSAILESSSLYEQWMIFLDLPDSDTIVIDQKEIQDDDLLQQP